MSTPRPWQGEDLPFGTVIENELIGTMLIVSPPGRSTRISNSLVWDLADHGALWLSRDEDPSDHGLTYLMVKELENEGTWFIIEDPS